MTTYAFPTLSVNPSSMEWWLESNTQVFESPLNNSRQTLEIPGARWNFIYTWDDLIEADWRILSAWLSSLRGQANRFTASDISRPSPRGSIAGTPLVNGASQTGPTLNIDGVTNGTTLLKGDLIGVNGELREIIADVTASGGAMALTLDCALRSSPADNAAITVTSPTATFMLTDPSAPRRAMRPPLRGSFTLQAVEAFA